MELQELKEELQSKQIATDDFNIKAYRHGVVEKWGGARQSYLISVVNNGVKKNFMYYDSIHALNHKLPIDLINAFSCIIRDGVTGGTGYSVDGFMAEFGYDSYNKANRVLRACENTYDKLLELFDTSENLYAIDEVISDFDY